MFRRQLRPHSSFAYTDICDKPESTETVSLASLKYTDSVYGSQLHAS